MGGPPAHELYRDLVLYAGLRLLRDADGNPLVALRDGENRRTFRVPSVELREAIDRFRMRRSLRPVPEQEMTELTRIAQARASDPDIHVPASDIGEVDPPRPRTLITTDAAPTEPQGVPSFDMVQELDSILHEIDDVRHRTATRPPTSKAPSAWNEVVSPSVLPNLERTIAPVSVSGGRMAEAPAGGLPHYVEALRSLLRDGVWLGTTSELSSRTGDDPRKVVASLLGLRSELARRNLVVATVETQEGWRWLAVDRSRLGPGAAPLGSSGAPPRTDSPSEWAPGQ
jgi:hypothetical protein